MSLFTNFNGESNVAYDGTFADLNLEYGSFLTQGADMQLFEDVDTQASFAPTSSYMNSGNSETVCMQQLEKTQSSEPQFVLSATDIPALDFSPTFTNETSNSTDPSPALSDDMRLEQHYTSLFQDLSNFNNSADPSPAIRDDMAADCQYMPSLYEAPKQPSVALRSESITGYESSPRPAVLDAISSGVRKNKRAAKPLPEINPDLITDPTAKKRAKNTAAARKSRQRKISREQELVELVEQLTADNEKLQKRLDAREQQLRAALGSPALPTIGAAF